jgi:hypothetical protein
MLAYRTAGLAKQVHPSGRHRAIFSMALVRSRFKFSPKKQKNASPPLFFLVFAFGR